MKLSRKWLNEFVDLPLSEVDDRTYAEAMSISGSKVEVTEDLSTKIVNVKVGRIASIEKHPNYIDGIWNQEDPEKWLTMIQVPVEKA